MKQIRFARTSIGFVAVLILLCLQAGAERDLNELVPSVMKLTRAVEGQLVYGEDGAKSSDEQLLQAAMKADPALGKELRDTRIKLGHSAKRFIVLVCSADGKRGWLEDVSWTPKIDKKWFELDQKHACEFTLPFDDSQTHETNEESSRSQ
jgi:hypothetical protein